MRRFLRVDDLELAGTRVLLRADLNVPLLDGAVADDYRIRATVPTVRKLRAGGATVVVCSHLGRPKDREPELRMGPVGDRLAELGEFRVRKLDEVVGVDVDAAVGLAGPGDVILLENTRFEPGETRNDPDLARRLAAPVDLFVLDAFGSAHRAHASTVGVTEHLPSAAGPLLAAEVEAFDRLLHHPPRPFIVVIGGAKVSDKLAVMRNLLPEVDAMLVGGGMCFTLLAAEGYEVGSSLVDEEMLEEVSEVLASEHGSKVNLPSDVVVADRFAPDAEPKVVAVERIPDGFIGLDIGPETAVRFAGAIRGSRSLFWNGPMGVFEWERFREGTAKLVEALAGYDGFSVVGGGDSVAALRILGAADRISHVSTGGGAGLELLEGRTLPGLQALERWASGE